MKKSILVMITALLLALALVLPVCAAEADTEQWNAQELGASLDAFLESKTDNHAAVAVLVFTAEDDLYTRYFGAVDAAGNVPLNEDHVLEWGSTTKLLVWISAMQLWEAGKLDLNEDIRTYLPDGFLKNLRFDKPVTMLNLMNHNAGFQETTFVLEVEDEEDIIPLGEYLATYQPLQVFEPGSVVAYSNWGAALAGYVVECIAGEAFSDYVQAHIFAPLEMKHSALAADLSDNAYVREKRKEFVSYMPDGMLSEENNKVFILPYPAGMCTSTLADFATFAKALLTRDTRLLSAEGFEKLYSPSLMYTGTDKARLYHGFLVDYEFASPIVGHDGNTMGGSSRLLLDLENNVGMVVLTNQLGGSVYRTSMAEIVFGTADLHIPVDGYYIPARHVFEGKMKMLYNLFVGKGFHITSEIADGLYVNVLPDRFEISTCDYLAVDGSGVILDVMAVLWMAFAGFSLIGGAVIAAVSFRKRNLDRKKSAAVLYGLMIALSWFAALPAVPRVAALVYAILLCVFGRMLVILLKKGEKPSRFVRVYAWVLYLSLAVTVLNYVLWDLIGF